MYKPFARFVTVTAAAGLALAATPLRAQTDADESASGSDVEEIVVTGSRIKRSDFVSPSPITTLDRDTIAAAPDATLEGLLNRLPQLTPNLGRASNNPGNGKAHIDLRGLGPGRTLVLLNARRFAPSGTGNTVDVNNIPKALIERVEIITGGASTVYGSDALAGVVNFITRTDFSGLSLEANHLVTERGDAGATDISVAWGRNFRNANVTFHGNFYDRDELFADARTSTRFAWQEDWSDGSLTQGGSFTIPQGTIFFPPYDLGSGPGIVTFNDDGTPRAFDPGSDLYNFQDVNYLQVPLERFSAGLFARFDVGDDTELFLESTFSANELQQELAPVPAARPVLLTSTNPIYAPETQAMLADGYDIFPGTAFAVLGRRMLEVGPRQIAHDTEYWRTIAGFRSPLGRRFDVEAWIGYATSDEIEILGNDVSVSRFEQSLLVDPVSGQCLNPSGGCVPVSIFGAGQISAAAADFLRVPAMTNTTKRTQKSAAVVITGSPVDGWAGAVDVAFGAEWREDDVFFEADAGLFTGDTLGYRGDAPVSGTEGVSEVFLEGLLPLYHAANGDTGLELEFGGRYSHYDDAGGVATYKAGLSWQASESLRLRSMQQHSVRAPNHLELFQRQFTEIMGVVFDPTDDPCSASQDPIGSGIENKCLLQGLTASQIGTFEAAQSLPVDFVRGGNPNLEPEEADTFTFGFVYSPTQRPQWNVAVDYFSIEMERAIGDIDAYDICFDARNVTDVFCDKLQRGPSGDIFRIEEIVQNRGTFETSGIDTQLSYTGPSPSWLNGDQGWQLQLSLLWTHLLSLESQENPASSVLDCRGFFGAPCNEVNGLTSKNRVAASVGLSSDRWRAAVNTRWIQGTDNWGKVNHLYFNVPQAVLAIPGIGSQFYADFDLSIDASNRLTVALGIANLFDRDPPQLANRSRSGNNTETGVYDVFGRSYRVSLSYRFDG